MDGDANAIPSTGGGGAPWRSGIALVIVGAIIQVVAIALGG